MKEKFIIESIELLKKMIATPSLSRQEDAVADLLMDEFKKMNLKPNRFLNNIWIEKVVGKDLPTILLNSHIDTVKPTDNWETDPFSAVEKDGALYGLGSNDAGASLVSLLATFRYLAENEQNYNLIFAATAEEEVSGQNGIATLLPKLGKIDLAVVGEPTQMQMAVAEKGLMVIDGIVKGKSGHAARDEGENAIYKALPIIEKIKNYQFEKVSPFLGAVKLTVTGIEAGTQHNVVPDKCTFMVDVRVNDCYSNQEVFEILSKGIDCELNPRSFRLNSSHIEENHPIVKRGKELGLTAFGSPTLSDQALMPFTSIKIGPGDSARSHTPNEFIKLDEIRNGVEVYVRLLEGLGVRG